MWEKKGRLWKLVGPKTRVLIRYGLLEFVIKALHYVSHSLLPKRVNEGRTQNEGAGRGKKDGEQKYGQSGVSSVNWEERFPEEFAYNI